jgi:hypothetical protein
MDLFVAQLAIVFLPGIIWAGLDARYASKTKPSETEFFIRAFTFGLASYAAVFLVYAAFGRSFDLVDLAGADEATVVTRAVADELLASLGVSLLLGVTWVYATNRKWLTRLLRWIGATTTYGDEDVWDYTFNLREPRVEYVFVRDFEKKIVYSGWVVTFSETGKLRELVLRDAEVLDFDGELLFETPLVYLARPPEDIHIEFPFRPEDVSR